MKTPLNAEELAKLVDCEAIIANGRRVWQTVGRAILEIKKLRLYRGDFQTFADYTQARWNMSARHADRLCEGMLPVMVLEQSGETNWSEIREAQARELAKVPEGKVVQVFAAARRLAGGAMPSARLLRSVASGETATENQPVAPDFGQQLAWLDRRIEEVMGKALDASDFNALAADLEILAEEARGRELAAKRKAA